MKNPAPGILSVLWLIPSILLPCPSAARSDSLTAYLAIIPEPRLAVVPRVRVRIQDEQGQDIFLRELRRNTEGHFAALLHPRNRTSFNFGGSERYVTASLEAGKTYRALVETPENAPEAWKFSVDRLLDHILLPLGKDLRGSFDPPREMWPGYPDRQPQLRVPRQRIVTINRLSLAQALALRRAPHAEGLASQEEIFHADPERREAALRAYLHLYLGAHWYQQAFAENPVLVYPLAPVAGERLAVVTLVNADEARSRVHDRRVAVEGSRITLSYAYDTPWLKKPLAKLIFPDRYAHEFGNLSELRKESVLIVETLPGLPAGAYTLRLANGPPPDIPFTIHPAPDAKILPEG